MSKPLLRWCLMAIAGLLQAAMLVALYRDRMGSAFVASHDDWVVFGLPFLFGTVFCFLIAEGLKHRVPFSLAVACVSESLGLLVCLNRYGA